MSVRFSRFGLTGICAPPELLLFSELFKMLLARLETLPLISSFRLLADLLAFRLDDEPNADLLID